MSSFTKKVATGEGSSDFLTHLALELGVGRENAQQILGEWLLNYKPLVKRSINILTPSRGTRGELRKGSAGHVPLRSLRRTLHRMSNHQLSEALGTQRAW